MGVAGFPPIAKGWKSQSDERALPLFWIVGAFLSVVGYFSFLLIYLSQPTSYQNPGFAAYTPIGPLPLPQKSDAPELADLPDKIPSPLTALAQAQTDDKKLKDRRAPGRNRPRVLAHENDQRTLGYGQQWNYGHLDWSSHRAWSAGRKLMGGPLGQHLSEQQGSAAGDGRTR
jgi:hypothetical protein